MRISTTCCTGTILLVAGTFLLFSGRKGPALEWTDPPGIVQIDKQLYMDCSEVSNFNWQEYLYWLDNVYGKSSVEYMAALPDTSLWKNESEALQNLETHYLRHPAYRNYPVVGLTYSQMTAYCQWRSDRVLEYLLIRNGKIEPDAHPEPETFFTTERYLAGTYKHYLPDAGVRSIPHFYLPNRQEWVEAEAYAQEVYSRLSARQRKKSPDVYYASVSKAELIQPVSPENKYQVHNGLYNLHRNVSEQLSDSTQAAGENWKQGRALEESETTSIQLQASVTKGFRCAFEWKNLH